MAPSMQKGEPASRLPFCRATCGPPVRLMPADQNLFHRLLLRSLRHRYNRHVSAAFGFGRKLTASIRKREQRVVLTHADIGAGVPLGATLARDDVAGDDDLAAELFQSEAP